MYDNQDEEILQPVLTIEKGMYLKENTVKNLINNCITNPNFSQNFEEKNPFFGLASLAYLLGLDFQETCTTKNLVEAFQKAFPLNYVSQAQIKIVEIILGKYLKLNSELEKSQLRLIHIHILQK